MSRSAYIIGILAAVAVLSTIAYTYFVGMEMGVRNAPLLEAVNDIESELTQAHLWLEESVSGDPAYPLEKVLGHIGNADENARNLLEGGEGPLGWYTPLADEDIRRKVQKVRKAVAEFRDITLRRWESREGAGAGSDIDREYDAVFARVLETTGKVESHLKGHIAAQGRMFKRVVLVLFVFSLSLAGYMALYMWKNLIALDRSRQKVQASLDEISHIIEELKWSERSTKAIVDTVGDAIVTINESGIIETFNQAATHIFGYTPDEAIGQNVRMLMPEPFRGSHDTYLSNYLRTGEKKIIGRGREAMGLHQNGREFPIYINITEAILMNKRMFVGVLRDITDRKEFERSLESLASFPELNPNPIVEIDYDCHVTYVNSVTDRIFPKLTEQGCRHPLLMGIDETIRIFRESGQHFVVNTVKIGDRYFEQHISHVPSEGRVRLYVMDITERKKVEERLRLSSKFFEETTEALVVTDLDGTILDVNDAFEEMSGFSREEVLGKNPRIMKSGRHDADFYREMWRSIIDKGSWHGEIWDRRKNGELYPKWLSIATVKDDHGNPTHYVGLSADISKLKKTEEQLEFLAHYDQLTGLPNRLLAHERLEQAITLARRHGHQLAVLLLDLDEFKRINDSLGHLAGDQLLIEVGKRLQDSVRDSDNVSRLGGDEFTIMLRNIKDPESAAHISQKILDSLAKSFDLNGHEVFISTSIGISLYPDDGEDIFTLIRNADAAMYHAKHSGKNNYQFFTEKLNASIMERLVLETRLRRAVEHHELNVHYQPRIEVSSERVVGMEALLRWDHPEYGHVSPSRFIPMAEDMGLIVPLGEWVLTRACRQTVDWNRETGNRLSVSVNLSVRQFRKEGLEEDIRRVLEETGLEPELLELEITESVVMEDVEKNIKIMKKLRDMGISLSVDDFGTGYSSLSYLKRFPINSLKIDRSFVSDITIDSDDRAVVESIIVLARSLGLKVIAEGVETSEQFEFIRSRGCDQIQGYYFSRAVPADIFLQIIKEGIKS